MKTMKTATITTAALAVVIGLTGCLNTVTPADNTEAPTQTPAPSPKPARIPVGKFGDSITFPGGVSVKVPVPAALTASQYADGAIGGKVVRIDVVVTNGSSDPIDGSVMSYPSVTYGSEGTAAETAFEPEQNISSMTTILPGETQTATDYYSIPPADYGSVRVEVSSPNLFDDPAIFKGAVK